MADISSPVEHKSSCGLQGCDCHKGTSVCAKRNHSATSPCCELSLDLKKKRLGSSMSSSNFAAEKETCLEYFESWSEANQVEFVRNLLTKMSHYQHGQISSILEPLLQRDFVSALPARGIPHLAEHILSYLSAHSLLDSELVSRRWQAAIADGQLWRKLILRQVATEPLWRGLVERKGWLEFLHLRDLSVLPLLWNSRRRAGRFKQADFPLLGSGEQTALPPCPPLVCQCQCYIGSSAGANASGALGESSRRSSLNSVDVNMGPGPVVTSPGTRRTPGSPESPPHGAAAMLSMSGCLQQPLPGNDVVMAGHRFYKQLYPRILRDIKRLEDNWLKGSYHLTRITCNSEVSKGVYCLQYDETKIVSGLRDNTIKVWRHQRSGSGSGGGPLLLAPMDGSRQQQQRGIAQPQQGQPAGEAAANAGAGPGAGAPQPAAVPSGQQQNPQQQQPGSNIDMGEQFECVQVLSGHTGSVLCLQYDTNLIISGSSDATVRVWDLATSNCLKVLYHHSEAVLHLRFLDNILVTCSKDRSIAVWDINSPTDLQLRQVLVGHRAAVNVVDFDRKYIVSASGDRTIKVWDTVSCEFVRTLTGHRRGIACLQYRDRLVVSGSSDNTIRIWEIETGVCFRVLEGHEELVRCIRFDNKRIVSGAYDGKIKVWDLKAALNPRSKTSQLCLRTLHQHTGRVFRLQFDDFQIVSSSHDDTILIWDFLRPTSQEDEDDGFDDGAMLAVAAAGGAAGDCGTSLSGSLCRCRCGGPGEGGRSWAQMVAEGGSSAGGGRGASSSAGTSGSGTRPRTPKPLGSSSSLARPPL